MVIFNFYRCPYGLLTMSGSNIKHVSKSLMSVHFLQSCTGSSACGGLLSLHWANFLFRGVKNIFAYFQRLLHKNRAPFNLLFIFSRNLPVSFRVVISCLSRSSSPNNPLRVSEKLNVSQATPAVRTLKPLCKPCPIPALSPKPHHTACAILFPSLDFSILPCADRQTDTLKGRSPTSVRKLALQT